MAEQGYAEQVRSLLLPISGYNLLLPGTMVAEVVSYTEPSPLPEQTEEIPWLLGMVPWRGERVPLIALETVMSAASGEPGSQARIAVIKGITDQTAIPHFGILTQQIPRLVTVHPETIEVLEDEQASDYQGIEAQVLVTGEPALVPDLEYLERELSRQLYE